jgi:hypothetical protein
MTDAPNAPDATHQQVSNVEPVELGAADTADTVTTGEAAELLGHGITLPQVKTLLRRRILTAVQPASGMWKRIPRQQVLDLRARLDAGEPIEPSD